MSTRSAAVSADKLRAFDAWMMPSKMLLCAVPYPPPPLPLLSLSLSVAHVSVSSPISPPAQLSLHQCVDQSFSQIYRPENSESCALQSFEGCCPDCKFPGDDCTPVWGMCYRLHFKTICSFLLFRSDASSIRISNDQSKHVHFPSIPCLPILLALTLP
jgi:hypothetical protein